MKKIVILVLVFIISIFLIFINFNKKKDTELKTIKLSEVAHSIFYAPQYIAINNGYFEEYGIKIDLSLTPGADKVVASILAKDADIGLSGSEATIYVYNKGEKDYLKTFGQLTQKDGSFIVSREKIDNFTLKDLENKKIIGGRIGGMPEMTLEWILNKNNIKNVDIDTSVAFSNMSSSFIGGNGDFVSLFEPNALDIEKNNYGYVVASLGELGGVIPYTSYSARKSYIENNKELISNFLKAINKGLDYVNNNSSKDIAKNILSFFPDTNLNDLEKIIDRYKNIEVWPKNTNFSKESFDHMQDIMINSKQLDKKVKYNDLIYINE